MNVGPVSMGTTLLGCKYDGGIILAADSRTSSFPVVSNKVARKINPITDRIYMCRAGNAADTQFVGRLIKSYINDHAIELGGGPTGRLDSDGNSFSPNVRSVANLTRLICYNNRDHLTFGFIIGGVDDVEGSQLYNIAAGGTLFERDCVVTGSGSIWIGGLVDSSFKPSMDKETALKWAITMVNHAMMRDNASGGIIRYVIINKDGATEGMVDAPELMKLELVNRT